LIHETEDGVNAEFHYDNLVCLLYSVYKVKEDWARSYSSGLFVPANFYFSGC
tara:strand:- start:262 stop:417 length:156 start_codon:yes stop_codon:yes gene_type:complete